MKTFEKVVPVLKELDGYCTVVSGGEPFNHPNLYEICSKIPTLFIIATNGSFITNPFLKRTAIAISKLPNYFRMQITSTLDLYPNYWEIQKHLGELKAIHNSILCTNEKIYVKNLGRAENFPIDSTYPTPSCGNGHLVARQTHSLKEMVKVLVEKGKFCTPMIDYEGKFHLSESWLCPSYGDVNTPLDIVWQKMKDSCPCGRCANWKVMQSMPKYSRILELLR